MSIIGDSRASGRKSKIQFGLALILFLLIRLVMVDVEWKGRSIPPEPDDAYHYLYQVRWIADYGLGTIPPIVASQRSAIVMHPDVPDIRYPMSAIQPYLGWTMPMAVWQRMSGLPAESVFFSSFLIGNLVVLAAIAFFARSFMRRVAIWVVLGLAAFCGGGAYHGFFWVVPSFYTLGLYLVLWAGWVNRGLDFEIGLVAVSAVLIPWLLVLHPSGWVLLGIVGFSMVLARRPWKSVILYGALCVGSVAVYAIAEWRGWLPPTLLSVAASKSGLGGGGGWKKLFDGFSRDDAITAAKMSAGLLLLIPGAWARRNFSARIVAHQVGLFSVLSLFLFAMGSGHPRRFFLFLMPFALVWITLGLYRIWRLVRLHRGILFGRAIILTATLTLSLALIRSSNFHRDFGSAKNFAYDISGFKSAVLGISDGATLVHNGLFPLHYFAVQRGLNFRSYDLELMKNPPLVHSDSNFLVWNRDQPHPKRIGEFQVGKPLFEDSFWGVYPLADSSTGR